MPVVIMCGGKGTRLREETEAKPKPMVEIGGRPILWHIMKFYAHHGHRDFILCLGYRGRQIKEYFLNHDLIHGDFSLDLNQRSAPRLLDAKSDEFRIVFAETGEDTLTGERLLRVEKYLPEGNYMLTYGDGVSNVDIPSLIAHHERMSEEHDVFGTITGIQPKSKYGLVRDDENGVITHFQEKPQLTDYTNGGFMVLNREFLQYCKPDQMLEDALIAASEDRKISLYRHAGFWHSMDTFKDKEDLEKLWATDPQWRVWDKEKISATKQAVSGR